jgi:glycosyltransferase involved in cell wall biosynthesis
MNGSGEAVRREARSDSPSRRVAIGYHFFPHYRAAVLEELCRRGRHHYVLVGDRTPVEKSIKPWDLPPDIPFTQARCWKIGPVVFQPGQVALGLRRDVDTIVLLGVAWYPFSWLGAILGRLTGKRVIFWSHGWIKHEAGLRLLFRRTYYRLAHAFMFYGHMAKTIAIHEGFDPTRIHVIYNSVDYEAQKCERARISHADLVVIRTQLFGDTETPIAICTTRLNQVRRLDLLIEALAELKGRGRRVNLLLVGDGPERANLEAQAESLGVTAKFYGACYDEGKLARLVMASNVTVAPGKVGLAAMTSMGYGRPVITHGDPYEQMPEWEAIIPGKTGSLFQLNDVHDLARAVEDWTDTAWTKEEVSQDCYRMIERFWNARFQRVVIERAIDGKPADDLFWMKEDIGAELNRPPRVGVTGAAAIPNGARA